MTDALHFSNNGHKFIASFLAKSLYRDTFSYRRGDTGGILPTWDSRSQFVGTQNESYSAVNVRQGRLPSFPSGAPKNSALVTAWVWCECPRGQLVYRGSGFDYYEGSSYSNFPKVLIEKVVSGNKISKTPGKIGFFSSGLGDINYVADMPYEIGALEYGLNKLQYINGSSDRVYFGYFQFVSRKSGPRSALAESGPICRFFTFTDTVQYYLPEELQDLSSSYGLCVGDSVVINFRAKIPRGGAVIIGSGPSSYRSTDNSKYQFWIAFRRERTSGLDAIVIYNVSISNSGSVAYTQIAMSEPQNWPSDNSISARVELSVAAGEQRMKFFNGLGSATPIIDVRAGYTDNNVRFGGTCGGLFYNPSATGVSAYAELDFMTIEQL